LAAAAKRTYDDAVAMADAVEVGDARPTIEPRVHYATIFLDPPDPGLVPGGFSMMRRLECASPDGEEQLHLRIVERGRAQRPAGMSRRTRAPDVAELFGLERDPEPLREHASDMHYAVAKILGHLESDIAFEYVD